MDSKYLENLGKYLQNQLIRHNSVFYEIPDERNWGMTDDYVPQQSVDNLFVLEEIDGYNIRVIGEGDTYDGDSTDIKLVDYTLGNIKTKVIDSFAAVQWNLKEAERNRQANSVASGVPSHDLVAAKLQALNRGVNRTLHKYGAIGYPQKGIAGFLNPDVGNKIPVVDASDAEPYQMDSTELYNWFTSLITSYDNDANMPYSRIVIYVSKQLFQRLASPIGDITGDSVYIRLTSADRGQFAGKIIPITELSNSKLTEYGIVDDDEERLLIGDYDNPNSVVRYVQPLQRTDLYQKFNTGVHWGVTGYGAQSEIEYRVPERFTLVKFSSDLGD